MARRPEEKYKPGELTRIKNNLGKLSEDEAKRMSEVLGGEIGIEQTDQNINDLYQELFKRNKKSTKDKWIHQSSSSNDLAQKKKLNTNIKYAYLDRIKLYYLASHPDHGIKTAKEIIKAIFDLSSKQKNFINPNLLESSNYFFFKSIKTLVKSTRSLSNNIQAKYIEREGNPFYWSIIDAICSWDIESIQEEIFILKRESPDITLESCASLIKLIYSPLIILSKVDKKNDLEGSVKYLYKLSTEGLFKKDLKIDRLRKSYTQALGEINNVFVTVKFRLYPLLLMFVSTKAYDYNTMFKLKGHEILNFLELNKKDLITFFDREPVKTEIQPPEDEVIEKETVGNISVQQGIILLDKMFPEAGWSRLSENPDMYPYFQTILNIPKEISLISQNDSLQKIVILIAILKDMFYGFSNIEYGFLLDDMDKPVEVKDKINLLIKNWYLFIDKLILKHYLEPLHEYCRHLERTTNLTETEYTKRIASDILWLRKTYIYPNMPLNLPKIMQPRTKFSIPKLYKSVSQLKFILKRMVLEIYSQGEVAIETIRNPEGPPRFGIENNISKRLISLLNEDNKKLTNAALILYTYEIVEVLDSIIQTTDNEVNDKGISGLFRSEGSIGFKPIYSVNSENTFFRLKDRKLKPIIDLNEATDSTDLLTDFYGKSELPGFINHFITNYNNSDSLFSIIHIRIHSFKSDMAGESIKSIKNTAQAISESIRLLHDIPFRTEKDSFYIIQPENNTSLAIKASERIICNINNINQLYIGVCEYKSGMDSEQLMTILENTISKQLPAPGITYFDANSRKYIQVSS